MFFVGKPRLKYWETESTARDTDYVVVNSGDNELVGLGSEESWESVGGGGSREGLEGEVLWLGGDTGFNRGGGDDGNVG